MLLLFEPKAASTGRSVPAHGARGPGHACFAVAEADLVPGAARGTMDQLAEWSAWADKTFVF
mgnify:CR=1 FL=1